MSPEPERGTAILIFARSSNEDLRHKGILKGDILFDTLNKRVLSSVERTGFPFFRFTEKEQQGSSFGERFVRAIQAIFDEGYHSVITLGNDTPQLQARHILEAEKSLKANHLVLGPSLDGGFYLMGIRKSMFCSHTFLSWPWQTCTLFQEISDWAKSQEIEVVSLKPLSDLDSSRDLRYFLSCASTFSKAFSRIISRILSCRSHPFHFASLKNSLLFTSHYYNKGSPILSFI